MSEPALALRKELKWHRLVGARVGLIALNARDVGLEIPEVFGATVNKGMRNRKERSRTGVMSANALSAAQNQQQVGQIKPNQVHLS
jgi:hypothetical protein